MNSFGAKSRAKEIPGITEPVEDGDTVTLGAIQGTAFLTEGHIDGHISYLFSNVLFCGDTLFTGGCGYLFDGPPAKMHHSLKRLSTLPAKTKICCAHEYTLDNLLFALSLEPENIKLQQRYQRSRAICENGGSVVPSTMEEEHQTNPFLRTESTELQQNLKKFYPHLQLDDSIAVFTQCREHKNRKLYRR